MNPTFATTMLAAAMMLTACNTNKPGAADTAHDKTTAEEFYLVIGSYNSADAEGIRVYRFDEATAQPTFVSALKGIENPSFVFPSADGTRLYAVGENMEPGGGTAHSLAFDKAKGTLTLLGTQPTHGDAPCNIIVSPDGKWVYTSNYNGGSITEFPLDAEGKLGEGRVIAFSGNSVDPQRQTQPHLHAVNFTPDGRYLLANDLGTDRVYAFPAAAPLDTTARHDIQLPAGMGPRHLTFSPDGSRAYLLGEISGHVVPLAYEALAQPSAPQSSQSSATRRGESPSAPALRPLSALTVCADSLGAEGSADIHISSDGHYLYTSHRLKGDGISIFRIDAPDGVLTKIGYQSTGAHPRHFTLSPSGRWLLVACRDADAVQIFARDPATGLLAPTGQKIEMPRPVCLQWVKG